ncbi:hypothetical protein ACG04R_00560 [Roseateles sp. BYS78W]|uniref:Carboxypeptidase regulatory-like domain-containing protein n=1 Tax=Pelomonas candidula TaxID=3299025 RepID=A0ABW7H6F9_9BURK
MQGTVAAGMAMSGGTVRVLDETGKVIASGKAVSATTGAYGPITLTGAGPFRVEACGTAGDHALCVWGATAGGTLNLTPLTSAVTVLASGQSPEALRTGAVQGLAATDLAAAQTQLRSVLASALADAGLAASFDLLTGALTPGSHTGYDRLLDTIDVGLGLDTKAYVTLGTALGSGWAYLEPGTTTGSLSTDASASRVDPAGVDSLFKSLGAVMPFAAKCPNATTGLTPLLDTSVRASADFLQPAFSNVAQATQVLCGHMAGLLVGDTESLEGATLLPTVPSRCDFSGTDPVCRVKLIFKTTVANGTTPKDVLRQIGIDQVAVRRAGGWLLMGNRLEVQASAVARLVLARRVDQTAPDVYNRYLDLRIPAWSGLQCARASQKDTSGNDVPLALFKPASGATYLSLWSVSSADATPSLDPANGATRGTDLFTLPVPNGAAGDTTARNFVRAGRNVKVELFSDAACSTPLAGADGGSVSIAVAGQLPLVASNMAGLPWPALATAATTALTGLNGAAKAKLTFAPTWTFPRADAVPNRAQLCTTDTTCGSKLADLELAPSALTAALNPTLGTTALQAGDYKLLRITSRTADGLVLQLDAASCTAQVAGQSC